MTLNANWSRTSGETRTEEYRAWRTEAGLAGVTDVDQVEYRVMSDGSLAPCAIVELCVADPVSPDIPGGVRAGCSPSPKFFEAVEDKVSPARPQGAMLRMLAMRIGVPALLVVYVSDRLLDGVWVHVLDRPGWKFMSLAEYRTRLGILIPRRGAP